MSFLPQSLSPEKIQNTDDSITEKKGGHHQKAFTAASTVKNVSSKVSTSGELSVSERVQPPKVLTPLSRGEKKPLQEKPHSKSGSVAAGVKPSLQNKKPLQEKPPSTSGSAAAGFKISLQNKKPLQEKPPSKSGSVEAGVKPSLLNKKPLQEKPPSSMGGSVAAGIKPSLQNKAAGSQSVSLSRSAGLSTTGTHSNGQTNNNSHTSAKFVAASKNSSKPMRSRKRSPQGLSPLLSSRFPVNAPSFVIPQMPSHDIGTYLPAASGSGSVCSTSLNGKTGVSRVTASSTYFPDLPAAIQQPNSIIGHTPQLSGHTPQLSGNTPQSSSMIGHTPYSISVMAHSSRSSWIPQSSSTIGHALSVKSSIQKQYQNSTVSKGTSKSVVQSPDGKTRRISVASPPLMTGFGLRRSRSSSTSSSALSSPSPPPAEMCISGEPRVGSVPSMIKRHKSTIHHTGFLDSGEYLSKKHAPIPIFQPKSLRNDSSSILQPSVSPSIVTVMSSSSKPSHSVMPSKPSHSPGSVVSSVAEIGKVTKTSAAHSRKTVAKGSKQSRRTSVSSLKSDTDSFSLPSSFHDPLKPMVVGSPKKYSSEATEITLPSPSHQYSPNRAFVTPYSPGTSSPTGVQSEVLNTRHGTGMGLPFGFPVAHSSGTASPSSVTSSSGTNFAMPTVDLSTMSRWEIEQLYYYNTAILEEQKRLMKLIERHLLETEQENKQTVIRKPSTFEVYKHFLEFLTEPETIPDASISIHGFSEDTEVNDVIVGGTPYQPIINNKYDVYRKFLNKT